MQCHFARENIKNLISKLVYFMDFGKQFPAALTAPNSPNIEIHVENLAHQLTVRLNCVASTLSTKLKARLDLLQSKG